MSNPVADGLTLLGKSGVSQPSELLEHFPKPEGIVHVEMSSDEVTALCPVTGQPDQYTVVIDYVPDKACIESKSLKLKLQSFRQVGCFCESLAAIMVAHVFESINPFRVSVTVIQKPRGGVTIKATATRERQV